VGETRFALTVK